MICDYFSKVWGEVSFQILKINLMIMIKKSIFLKAANVKNNVCLDVRGANFGQPIGVSGCHHGMGNQVNMGCNNMGTKLNFFNL